MRIAFLNPQGNFDRADSFLTEHPDFGGQLVYVKELSLALARMGLEVDIVTRLIDDPDWPGFSSPLDSYAECEDLLRIVRVACGGPRFLEKEKLWPHLPEMVANLLEFYGGAGPDYLTAHYADGGYMAALVQQPTGLGFTFTGHSLGAQKIDKLDADRSNINALEQRFHFAQRIDAERLAMQRADAIITSTSQERIEQYGHSLYAQAVDTADDSRFAVVPPGVNTRIFHDGPDTADAADQGWLAQRTGGHEDPYVLVSSRLDQKKNIAGVVEAFARHEALCSRARLGLFVRGMRDPFAECARLPDGERSVLEPILARIEAAELRERVAFFDIQSQRQLAAAYRFFARRGSAFVLSSFYEPFGLAPIEAAACGLAVVATRNGGPAEIFADGSAVLVDPADPDDIAAGILSALERHAHYADAGRRRVLSRYTWEQTAAGYLEVIQRHRGRAPRRAAPVPVLDALERITAYLD